MKTLVKNLFYPLVMVALFGSASLQAQNIRIFFYGPSAAMTTNFTGATAGYVHADSCGPNPSGYSYVLLDAQTAPVFRAMAPTTMIRQTYDSLTNANSILRRRLMQIRGLSNGVVNDIEIYLFDDRTGLAPTDTCKCDELMGGIRGVWPCATNFRRTNGNYLGYLFLGEVSANFISANAPGGWWAWYETVVHEFSHTQFALEYDAAGNPVQNKWGRDGIAISYGGDASHWGSELQADQQSALDEGLATFWGLERNRIGRDSLIVWLNRRSERLHLGSHSFLTGTPQMWNAPHAVVFSGTIPANRVVTPTNWSPIRLVSPHIQTGAGYELRSYRWLDVPGNYVLYNEQMFQAFALSFFENALPDRSQSFDMMLRAARILTPPNNRLRYPAVFANALANELETYARSAAGRAAQANNNLVSSMFTYALYDIVTHFGMTEADLQRELRVGSGPSSVPRPMAFDHYWTHRDAVKQRVCQFLGGPNCTGNGNIDFMRAVSEAKSYFTDAGRILR
jgi:hypothetical protein